MGAFPNNIPEKTVERLSEYRRTLRSCLDQGITHVFSHVLAGMHGTTAVQVRRDLMLIGFSSDTKKGYDVKVLIDFIGNILDSPEPQNIGVIGMGHLGQAITKYFNDKGLNLRIVAAFDNDPLKTGKEIMDVPVYDVAEFDDRVDELDINLAILAVPTSMAEQYRLPIINAGIKGVLNFTSKPLNFPLGIAVENYDITTLLEKLAYFVKESDGMQG